MISRSRYIGTVILVAAALLAVAFWVVPFVRGVWPAIGPAASIPSVSPEPDGSLPPGPLTAPQGWTVSLLTDRVPDARDMVLDFQGNLWVSQRKKGTVSLITLNDKGEPINISSVLRGLNKPHGLAFDPDNPTHLYVAQETQISRVLTYTDASVEKIADLPKGGRHTTRSLAFGSDGRLYVSIGSTCDTCRELNPEHGSIISMNRDGSDRRTEATGLRNAVFITAQDGRLWVTEMGRDNLGDDLPPDEINSILLGEKENPLDYGWPTCYGDGVQDTDFDKNQYVRNPCEDSVSPEMNLPAHVAPLGLSFVPHRPEWPSDWQGDLFVAYHGSWNRTEPVGYKVVAFDVAANGELVANSQRDIVTGFLVGGSALGRPVDVLLTADGTLYISDDKAGAIWQMKRK